MTDAQEEPGPAGLGTLSIVDEAESSKNQANKAFNEKHYAVAIAGYTKAIMLQPDNAVYYANRSIANLRLENYGSAVTDASKAIELDPSYAKAYYRRGDAQFALSRFKEAMRDFKEAAKLAPRDPTLRKRLSDAEREVKRIRFEEALAVPEAEQVVVSDTIDLDDFKVEEGYNGLRMDTDRDRPLITLDFVKAMMEEFRQQRGIHKQYAFHIVLEAQRIFKTQPSLVDVAVPEGGRFTLCGDVHGQFYDLLNIFEVNGLPSEDNPYLFNGDFVDRGSFSVEVILTLFALKCLYPASMHLARGNHESHSMNKIYGFDGEVKHKFNATLVEVFRETFRWLPLAHVLDNKVLVVHGGLFSKDGVKLADIKAIDRNREPPEEGLMCELLWSDPATMAGRSPSKRGVGVAFGPDVTKQFLQDNGLQLLVRSHEVKDEGYEVEHGGYCVTVFSAPNYCDQMGNKGAYIVFKGGDMTPHFVTFDAVPHPPVKPMAYATSLLNGMFGF